MKGVWQNARHIRAPRSVQGRSGAAALAARRLSPGHVTRVEGKTLFGRCTRCRTRIMRRTMRCTSTRRTTNCITKGRGPRRDVFGRAPLAPLGSRGACSKAVDCRPAASHSHGFGRPAGSGSLLRAAGSRLAGRQRATRQGQVDPRRPADERLHYCPNAAGLTPTQ